MALCRKFNPTKKYFDDIKTTCHQQLFVCVLPYGRIFTTFHAKPTKYLGLMETPK